MNNQDLINDKSKNGLTYAKAGVNIDMGNTMVEKIKPFIRATNEQEQMQKSADLADSLI